MILLMDRKASVEATELRERILEKGLPCAASFSPFDTAWLPHAHCVLTTRAGYATVRAYLASDRFADLPLLVVSEDVPETAYRTDGSPTGKPVGKTLPLVDALLPYIGSDVYRRRGNHSLFLPNGFVIAPLKIYFRATYLDLTPRERRILQFYLFHHQEPYTCRLAALCALPKPDPDNAVKESESIAKAIGCINRKTDMAVGKRFLRRVKGSSERSYYLEIP